MRKLIYIFLLLPIFVNGQILEKPSYPFKGYAFNGDGVNNYANFGGRILNDSIWTVALRIKKGNQTNIQNMIISRYSLYLLSIGQNGIVYYRDASYVYNAIGSGYDLNDGNEHDVIIRSMGGSAFIYIDGIYKGNGISGLIVIQYLFQLSNGIYKFEGKAYDVRLWKSDIGESECLKYHSNTMDSIPYIWLPLNEGGGNKAYDVSGNGINATIYGSNYWTEADNDYNENYGVTKLKYNGDVIFVPYKIDKTPIYNHSSPVMNASELFINYPASRWGKTYWVK